MPWHPSAGIRIASLGLGWQRETACRDDDRLIRKVEKEPWRRGDSFPGLMGCAGFSSYLGTITTRAARPPRMKGNTMRSILNMILGLDNTMSGVPVTTMNSAVTLSLMNDGADARGNN